MYSVCIRYICMVFRQFGSNISVFLQINQVILIKSYHQFPILYTSSQYMRGDRTDDHAHSSPATATTICPAILAVYIYYISYQRLTHRAYIKHKGHVYTSYRICELESVRSGDQLVVQHTHTTQLTVRCTCMPYLLGPKAGGSMRLAPAAII